MPPGRPKRMPNASSSSTTSTRRLEPTRKSSRLATATPSCDPLALQHHTPEALSNRRAENRKEEERKEEERFGDEGAKTRAADTAFGVGDKVAWLEPDKPSPYAASATSTCALTAVSKSIILPERE
ncbi:hypothetical protein DFQ27_002041 [Actinomortierella ambigua]|uniref:Uncharacterized protein n=1 Tax=Actinomortierella ambigua TaxID=1343610 RepID=A0A9P6QD17_9FUNG|nr:hypothetical protein DFQ27_002041 [Actinomortierella ambigua]